jgi:hypothetical protein
MLKQASRSSKLLQSPLTNRGTLPTALVPISPTLTLAATKPATTTHRARPAAHSHTRPPCPSAPPTCSWFLLMPTPAQLRCCLQKEAGSRGPDGPAARRPGLRLEAKETAPCDGVVSSESAGRRWPVAPRLDAQRRRGEAGRDGFGVLGLRRVEVVVGLRRGRSSSSPNSTRAFRSRGRVGARAPAAHGPSLAIRRSVSRGVAAAPAPPSLVRVALRSSDTSPSLASLELKGAGFSQVVLPGGQVDVRIFSS